MKEFIASILGMAVSDMTPAFLIAQAIGPIVTVMSLVSSQLKKLLTILWFDIIANLLCALSYILLDGISGAYICLIAIVQAAISAFHAHQHKKVPNWITGIFIAIYIGTSIFTYTVPMDVLPGVCSVLFALAIAQSGVLRYRVFMSLNSFTWIIYDLLVGAYTMILTHGLFLGALIIAIIRFGNGTEETK